MEMENAVIFNVINYSCAFPAITYQNVCGENGLIAITFTDPSEQNMLVFVLIVL